MEIFKFTCNDENDTISLAKSLASKINDKCIILLEGELGSGKTKFTEGFLTFFNLQDEISSPTFTIVNEYLSDTSKIYHFDLYRLENISGFFEIGGEEYFQKGICIIEWGESLEDYLQHYDYIKISFKKDLSNINKRFLTIHANGDNNIKIISSLLECKKEE